MVRLEPACIIALSPAVLRHTHPCSSERFLRLFYDI